jgi:hypothetical protein
MTKKRRHGNPKIKDLGIATRFRPGASGNPGGRPKTRILAEMLASVGDQLEAKSGKTYFQLAAEALVGKAFNGDVQAFKEFADRIDGRATQHVELGGPNGRPIAFESHNTWEQEWQTAGPERRKQLITELDDKILASAQRILAEKNRPEGEQRYKDRMAEYNERCVAGEDPKIVLATMQTPPVGLMTN